jgi:tetratricopeptide (TPR) repeat protein
MARWTALLFLFALPALPQVMGRTVLVLPFFNRTDASVAKASTLDWIGVSLSESIQEALLAEGQLVIEPAKRAEVFSRLSLKPLTPLTRASILKAAQALDADTVIYGEYALQAATAPATPEAKPSRGDLRITASILEVSRLLRGPEFLESGPLEEFAGLQSRLGWQSLQFLAPEVAPSEEEYRRRVAPVRVDAIEQYVRGLIATSEEQKLRHFSQAARLESTYSAPCYQLGRIYFGKRSYREAAEWFSRVSSSDVHYRDATFRMGVSRFELGDYRTAQSAFLRVTQEVPVSEAYNNLGAAQSRLNLPEALDSFRKALEGDAGDIIYLFNSGYSLWKQGVYDRAADYFRSVLDRDAEDAEATTMLGRCLKKAGPRAGAGDPGERLKLDLPEQDWLRLRALLPKAPAR